MKPNLFTLATKELSQDAFIAWLLQWADPDCKLHNANLHAVALLFLNQLISLQGTPPDLITEVKAGRQWENIDVWAEVNDSHLIVIEDKIGAGQHSDQLSRYRATGEKWCKEHGCELVCVYIKTQSDSNINLQRVQEQGFAVFSRRQFLDLLEAHDVVNDIYTDFRDRLKQIEHSESQFNQKIIQDWDGNDWKGFYQAIEKKRAVVNWGYVNNPAGGFWNLQLNWFGHDDVFLYMQIEQGNLCFKVGEVYENQRDVRERFHELFMSASHADMSFERPGRFGSGKYMTVGIIPRRVWLGEDDVVIDLDSVLSRINRYETWLEKTIGNAQ